MSDVITSLCYINNIKGTTIYMDRIADFFGDHFEEYDMQTSFSSGCDREFIVGFTSRISSKLHSIGVYDWTYFEDNGQFKTDVSPSDIPWTEVVISSFASTQEIINEIKHGWQYIRNSGKHDLIICCKPTSTTLFGVCLPEESLRYDSTTFTFDDKTMKVEVGKLYKEDLFSCHDRLLLLDQECWHVSGKEPIKTVSEVLDEIVGTYIKKIEKDVLSRHDRQTASKVLSKLSADTIVDVVAEKLQCTKEDAFKYIEDYIKTHSEKLENDRILKLVETLVESDSNAVMMLRERVTKNWETENSKRIAEAHQKIDNANENLQHIIEEQEQARNELSSIVARQKEATAQYDKTLQKQDDVEAAIALRLEEIRTDPVKAAVDEAFWGSAVTRQIGITTFPSPTDVVCGIIKKDKGYYITVGENEESIESSSIEENFGVAAEWFENYCSSECDHKKLLLFLFATYTCCQHLIITGETAEALASAYAIAVTGVHAPIVSISGAADAFTIDEELRGCPHTIIIVRELDHAGYEVLRELMRREPQSQFLLIRDHEETLLMEPSSMYTTFFPVLTDMFCQSTGIAAEAGYSCCSELYSEDLVNITAKELLAEKSKNHKWLSTGFVAPLLEKRCAQIHILMRRLTKFAHMTEQDSDAAAAIYLYVPILKCLQHTDELTERIKAESVISNETKKLLLVYSGAENE